MLLASRADVLARMGDRDLDQVDDSRTTALLEEASALVEGYLRRVPEPVPDAVRLVVARMVTRALSRGEGIDAAADSFSQQAGPYSVTTHYASDSLGGGVWLSAQDKLALRPFRRFNGVVSVGLS